MTKPIEWEPEGNWDIPGIGMALSGPWPFEDVPRRDNVRDFIGRELLVSGEVRRIKAIETFARMSGPRPGESVGFVFEPLEDGA